MAVDLETVVKQLADSGIIALGKLENFVPPKASPKDGEALLRELHKQKLLTTFQAQQFAQGRAKALILGNYTLIDKIGAGGMGQVFKAEHRRMKRLVAIKMLPKAMLKDAAAAARFQREVEAAAKLRHTNIVAADDADEANGVHFLVMECVEGSDLSALVKKNGPFPVAKAINYILQAARGLEFAHKKGVIHRDIKPANLLLDNEGVVKILDMGLARISGDGNAATQAELTGTGAVMGTVDYMAPEQGLSTKHADARADIYSLGCSLHFLLIGKPTFDGETVTAKLLAHHNSPPPNLCELRSDVPQQLQAVFAKMVAKKIEDRYQTMSEVIADLECCQGGLSSSTATVKTSGSSGTEESEMTVALGSRRMQAIPAVEAYEEPERKGPPHKNIKLLAGAGAAGFLLLLLGVIVIFRNQKGQEVGRMELPDGTSVEVQTSAKVDPAKVVAGQPNQPPPPSPAMALSVPAIDAAPPLAKAPFDAAQAHAYQAAWAKHLGTTVEQKNPVGMMLVLIPPGEFLMGSTDEQVAAALKVAEEVKADQPTKDRIQKDERPQHRVVITKPLLMSATEVTVGQFRKFIEASEYVTEAEQYGFGESAAKVVSDKVPAKSRGLNWKSPGYAVTDDSPVAQVTWNDACAYCAWLSEKEQRTPCYRTDGKGGWLIAAQASGYRLPTEAEWEYACRAGTTTQYSFGDDYGELEQFGWYSKNAGGKAQPVGMKLPNPFGLFDMHGNLQEWCQDFFDEMWYEKPQPNDPKGPSSGSNRVLRGGSWYRLASLCRSAYRNTYSPPSTRLHSAGFRCVRVADAAADSQLATNTTTQPATPVTSAGQPNQPWNTPAFQAWLKETQALPAEQQIEAVSKKLMELNPGFDGKLMGYDRNGEPKIDGHAVTELGLTTDSVRDLSPLRAFAGLQSLDCSGSGSYRGLITDLSVLQGLPLVALKFNDSRISSLAPLQGMPLKQLSFFHTGVSDLSPLLGMPLSDLTFHGSPVSDLTPLGGMPLVTLHATHTKVSDLVPLKSCRQLTMVRIGSTQVTAAGVADLLKALPNCKTDWSGVPAKPASTNKLAYFDPAFQKWVEDTQKLPAEQQIEAVSKKLIELNPGFDGKVTGGDGKGPPKVESGVVLEVRFVTDNVTDISPVRALVGLKSLYCSGSGGRNGKLSDLSPLKGMDLAKVDCQFTNVSDLSPLQGLPLTLMSCHFTQVSDLSPLKGMPLSWLYCGSTPVNDLSPLRGMPLTYLDCYNTQISDLSPLKGMPLTSLKCNGTQISDLSAVQGMPLKELSCYNNPHLSELSPLRGMILTHLDCGGTRVSDISPLQECKNLIILIITRTKVTAASVAALQKALPNCKIEWDDPAKPKTPEPAASGTK